MSPEQIADLGRHLRADVERLRAIPNRTTVEQISYEYAGRDYLRYCERYDLACGLTSEETAAARRPVRSVREQIDILGRRIDRATGQRIGRYGKRSP